MIDLMDYKDSVYSQYGEDGMISSIIDKIGLKHGIFVDVGAGNGTLLSNTRNLHLKGWSGLLIEANQKHEEALRSLQSDTIRYKIATVDCGLNSLNRILQEFRLPSIELLSIDVDGNDYWIFRTLHDLNLPDILVIEYNSNFWPNESYVIEYDPLHKWDGTRYYGASSKALIDLASDRGYTLVGYTECNLIFVSEERVWNCFRTVNSTEIPKIECHKPSKRKMFMIP